ncbi:MAG: hypothetical protein U0L11_04080 [Acutalibacteraceae bacterium]|nr:hypothetical protein [Acutalibacteraceae bacterium]
MATCNDCIHNEACKSLIPRTFWDSETFCEDCKYFKDKSRYIELPCKFLQKCFVIPTIENRLNEITEMKCIGFAVSNDSHNANLITDKNKLYQPCFGAFGKTVFLTRKEAEKALKEREQE